MANLDLPAYSHQISLRLFIKKEGPNIKKNVWLFFLSFLSFAKNKMLSMIQPLYTLSSILLAKE